MNLSEHTNPALTHTVFICAFMQLRIIRHHLGGDSKMETNLNAHISLLCSCIGLFFIVCFALQNHLFCAVFR